MDFLLEMFLGNTLLQWIGAGAIIPLTLVVLWVFQHVIVTRLRRLADATKTEVDGLVLDFVSDIRWWVVLLLALYLATLPLNLPDVVENTFRTLAITAVLIQVGMWGTQLVAFLLRRYVAGEAEDSVGEGTAYGLLNFVLRTILWSIVVLMVLDNLPGVQITSLIAGLGIGSVAIALAVQEILSDIFASVSIVLDKPFVVGDSIEVGAFSGEVERIGLKTTRVRSVTGEELIFANSDLLESRIRNYRRMRERRVVITIGVAYETPHEKLARIPGMVQTEFEKLDDVRFDRAHLREMTDFALVYEIVYWVLVPDYRTYMDTLEQVNLSLLRRFEEEDINLPYPTQRLLMRQSQETPEGAQER